MLYNLCENGRVNWVAHINMIKNILYKYRFGYVYTYQEVWHPKQFLSYLSERIVDCYKQEWNSLLNDSSKLSDNFKYKDTFEFEKYLNIISIRKYRTVYVYV